MTFKILEDDEKVLDEICERYTVGSILNYLYWRIVHRHNAYKKNNPHSLTRQGQLLDLANKIDELEQFSDKIGE